MATFTARFRVLLVLAALLAIQVGSVSGARAVGPSAGPTIIASNHNDVSAPLRTLLPPGEDKSHKVKQHKSVPGRQAGTPGRASSSTSYAPAPPLGNNFDGVGQGFTGPNGTFTVSSAPPDTNGAAGPNHFFEIVNTDLAVFNKSGTPIYGPVPINTVWSGFGGPCQADNDGDPSVLYDNLADRWLVSQFAVTGANLMCVAVSTSGDPTGTYNRYSFPYSQFPDYPKLSIWPDGYYLTVNLFQGGSTFVGAGVAALDRTRMLAGQPATQQLFNTGSTYGSLLPSSLDGARLPPAGAPNHLLALGNDNASLLSWNFHVDWTTPANSTFIGPSSIAVAAFAPACGGGTCIPQVGTTQQLDSLADRLMYRLAYRNFGDHESIVANHSVTVGSSVGVRWYELRMSGANPTLYQQGTYSPDTDFRWMGSIAMDQAGDIALGYSKSSAATHPGIAYVGRLPGDALGQMTQGEGAIFTGGGSQTGSGLSRWGDYSSMSVDPADDCTFWYSTEYIPSNGAFNWKTRVANFKFANCGAPPGNDFSISANPSSVPVNQGASGNSTISTTVLSGSAESVSLSATGLPAGATASFNPTSVTAGASSTLTLGTAASTPAGTYPITVTGTATSATHSTSVSLVVTNPNNPILNGGFESGDFTGWTRSGSTAISSTAHSGTKSAMVGGSAPTSGDSSIAQTFTSQAAGGTLSFFYNVKCPDTITYDWATATLRDNTAGTTSTMLARTCTNNNSWLSASSTLAGSHSYTLNLISHDDNYPGDPTYTLYDDVSISAPASGDFSISANPATVTVQQGASGTSTISTALTSGSAQSISLSAAGLPAGATASFNPTSVTTGGSSTLTLSAGAATTVGSYTVTVTGTGSSATHSTTVTLNVTAPPPPDFSISASPGTVSAQQGGSATSSISTAVTSGSAQSITLSATGLPTDASASFNPVTITAGNSSTLTLAPAATTPVGSYTITVTGTGTSNNHSTTVTFNVTAPPPPDFSISPSPSTVSIQQGSSGNSTITTAVTSGAAQSISLSANGLPAGATASFVPSTITAGASSTLTLAAAASTPAGTYPITVTGTGTSATHTTSVSLVVTAPASNPIVNGNFETGDFTGWTRMGSSSISNTAHAGAHSGLVGATTATNGDSSIAQTFIAPAAGGALSFYYNLKCPDSVTYDWATATLRDNTAATTTTMLARTCSNTNTWVKVSANVTAGHSYTLTLVSHDDNYAGDPTYTLYDDVTVGALPPPPPPPVAGITNGGFETGDFTGWTRTGTTSIAAVAHTGGFSGQAGGATATNGDSSIAQTFTAAAGATQLALWYSSSCPDTVTYDWVTITFRDNTAGTTQTLLPRTCAAANTWTQVTASVVAGHSYTLTLVNHDDNFSSDPTYTRFDDVGLS